MTGWPNFLWLTREAADGLLFGWPITAALSAWLVLGVKRVVANAKVTPRGGWLFQLAPVVVPICILTLGTVFACHTCASERGPSVRHHWATRAVDGLTLLQLAGAIWLVRVAPGARILSAALQAMFLWWSFWAGFMSYMSISGDWI